jgi:hypothetical protein
MSEAKDNYDDVRPSAKDQDSKGQLTAEAKADDDYVEADSKVDSHCGSVDNKQDVKVEEPFSNDEILEKLQRFFFEDSRFGQKLEEFVHSKSDVFDLDSEEYKLQYTSIYEEYKALFENLLEGFIDSELKCSISDVYRALKSADDQSLHNPNSMDAFFAQVLIASTDFEVFMSMLKDAAKQHSRK